MFLITGCGRSGTTYITQVLQRCGLDVGHERMGRDGIVSGFYAFDAPKYPGKHPTPRPQFDVVLHQVRAPLAAIASLQTGHSWDWVRPLLSLPARANVPALPIRRKSAWLQPVRPKPTRASMLTLAAYDWLIANENAERMAVLTYRIEALEAAWPELQRLLGFTAGYGVTAGIPKTANTRQHRPVTWGQVKAAAPEIYTAIRDAATRYGYVLIG